MATTPTGVVPRRDPTIDVLRGLCIASMVVAHLASGSPLDKLTHMRGIDGATGFVLLSGLVLGMVHSRAAREPQPGAPGTRDRPTQSAVLRLARRAALVWFVHVLLVLFAVLTAPWSDKRLGIPNDATPAGIGEWPRLLWLVTTLQVSPNKVGVLALYVLLFGSVVVGIVLLRAGRLKTLVSLSALAYAAGAIVESSWWSLSRYPGEETHFNVAMWQALFVSGLVIGWQWHPDRLDQLFTRRRTTLLAATGCAALVLLAQPLGDSPLLAAWPEAAGPLEAFFAKYNLGPGRILLGWCLFALLYAVVRHTEHMAAGALARTTFLDIGRRSLDGYVLLTLMFLALFVLAPYELDSTTGMLWAAAGLVLVRAWAALRASYDDGRRTSRPRDAVLAGTP